MKPTTDIEQVKSVARALLMTEVNKTPYSPDSGTAPIHLVRLCGNNEGRSDAAFRHNRERRNLQAWQVFMRKQINITDNAYEIYMMTNKPYSLTFLKYASPYL